MNKHHNPYGVIPLHEPAFGGNEKKYLDKCIESTFVSTVGEFVNKFEDAIADYIGAKYAVACVNGTSAIHISLLVSGVKRNDEVIVPTLTFIAPINAVKYIDAFPVFMDCDDYFNIDIKKTIEFLQLKTFMKDGKTYNAETKRRISAIIPVHVFGNPIEIDELVTECKERNIVIIEDATESLGSKYISGNHQGSFTGTIGELGCFSFNGNKIITTGGGGMIVTNDKKLADYAKYLTTQAKNDTLNYVHDEIGYNYRLTNVQAAIGLAQLEQLDKIIKIKKQNFEYYNNLIKPIRGLKLIAPPEYSESNYWLYALQIDFDVLKTTKDELIQYFNDCKIHFRPLWYLNHLQKPFIGHQLYKIENAFNKLENTVNIPSSYILSEDHIKFIVGKFIRE